MARRPKDFDDSVARGGIALAGMAFLVVVLFPKAVDRLLWWAVGGVLLGGIVAVGFVILKASEKDSPTSLEESQPGPRSGGEILRRWLEENRPESSEPEPHADGGERGGFSRPKPEDDSRYGPREPAVRNAPVQPGRGTGADSRRAPRSLSHPDEIRAALRLLDWFQFEKLVTLYYQTQGFSVKRVGGAKPDGGVDMTLEHEGQQYVIQCKHWKKWKVRVKEMREFLGTLTDTGIPNGIYITTCGYTDDARDLASKHGIQLFEESQLVQCIIDLEMTQRQAVSELLADRRKFCPRCESEMFVKEARKGRNPGSKFWGCSRYPRCKYTFDSAEKE